MHKPAQTSDVTNAFQTKGVVQKFILIIHSLHFTVRYLKYVNLHMSDKIFFYYFLNKMSANDEVIH